MQKDCMNTTRAEKGKVKFRPIPE